MVQRKSVSVWENSWCVLIDYLGKSLVSQILGVVRRKEWTERAKARQRMWWRFRTGKGISKSCEGKGTEETRYHRKGGYHSATANCKGEAARSASPVFHAHLRCVDLALVGLSPPLSCQKALVEHLCVNIMCQHVV